MIPSAITVGRGPINLLKLIRKVFRPRIVVLTLLVVSYDYTNAQNPVSFNGSGLLEQIGLPDFRFNGGNPGFGVRTGVRYTYLQKEKCDLAQTADVMFITKNAYGNTLLLVTQFDFRRKLKNWMFDFQLGPGYSLFYSASPVYVQNMNDYTATNKPIRKFNTMGTIAVTYAAKRIQPFIACSIFLEYPFINSSSVILPHQTVEVGVSLNLKRNEDVN
jgi:hypothetical protein